VIGLKKGVVVAMLLFFLLVIGMVFSAQHVENDKNNNKVAKTKIRKRSNKF